MALTENQTTEVGKIKSACTALRELTDDDQLTNNQKSQVKLIEGACAALNAGQTGPSGGGAPDAKGYARLYNGVLAFTGAIMGALFIGYPNTSASKISYQYWTSDNAETGPAAAFVNTAVVYEEILGRLALLAVIATIAACYNQVSYGNANRGADQEWHAILGMGLRMNKGTSKVLFYLTVIVIGLGVWAAFPLIETMFIGRPDQ